ncbi:MAG: histidine kinase, partial [Fimbriimonadaceae bacterium]|nr:histidine kinase [Chitinophagales bacterium]
GFLWFATDNGLSRFDGSKSNYYGVEDGLPGNIITALTTDEAGNVYAGLKRNGIFVFENNTFKKIIEDTTAAFSNHKILVDKNIIYTLRRMARLTVLETGSNVSKHIVFQDDAKPIFIYRDKAGNIYATTTNGLYSIKTSTATKLNIPECNNHPVYYISETSEHLVIATADKLLFLKNNVVEKQIAIPQLQGQKINNFLIDRDKNIWISTFEENNFYVITNGQCIKLNNKLQLSGTSVNDLVEDNEGNVWAATYGKGVFCFHNMYCTNYDAADGLTVPYITSLQNTSTGDLFIGTYNGAFYFDGKEFIHIKQFPDRLEHISHIHHDGNDVYVCRGNALENIYKNNKIPYKIHFENAAAYYTVDTAYRLQGKWNNTIYKQSIQGQPIDSILLNNQHRANKITALYKDADGTVLCGTNNGLFKILPDNTVEKFPQKELQSVITTLHTDKTGRIWVGTLAGAVILKDNEIEKTWNPKSKSTTAVSSIISDNKNRIWIGTLTGLYLLTDKNILFDSRTCLLNEEVSSLAYDAEKNVLWIGTNAGLSKIDITKFDALKTYTPAAIFKNIRTQDASSKILADTTLGYNRNNFTVRFSAIHFTNPAGVKFFYKVDNSSWEPATGRQVEFAGLPYGEHIISIVAENDRGEKGDSQTISITIDTPYWATWWYKTLIALILLTIAFLLIRWRFLYEKRKQKEQLELQHKISELRHQALNTSMNPHFIFNSLNSIQQFINTHNTEEASEYLGKFARLIRIMLDNGNKSFISLDEELNRLNRYLELEKIRFGGKLNYTMQVQENIDIKNVVIPNMILQPFVENALWHGVLPSNENGNILIDFSQNNGTLKVLIDDDGIGIHESSKRKKVGHRSLGMQMILERIQLLKKLNGNDISIEVKDKSGIDKTLHGTKVEIQLQVQNKLMVVDISDN